MSLKVGIHLEPLGQFSPGLIRYERILVHNGVDSLRLCSSSIDFWDKVSSLDLFIYRWRQWDTERQNAKSILPVIEHELSIPCFPNQRTWWSFDDKIREYYLMRANSFPMAQSWIFWERDKALQWAKNTVLPVVFKLSGGAGSLNVVLVKERSKLKTLIRQMFKSGMANHEIRTSGSLAPNLTKRLIQKLAMTKRHLLRQTVPHRISIPNWVPHKNYVLFQEFLPGNDFDTRVTVIGERAFAFRRFNRKGDFRSSGSGKIDYNSDAINLEFVKTAFTITQQLGFQTMAYDFLYGKNGEIKFCEISYSYVDTAVYQCSGYWDINLNWHKGHYWPQYFHLVDSLKLPGLRQPENLDKIA